MWTGFTAGAASLREKKEEEEKKIFSPSTKEAIFANAS